MRRALGLAAIVGCLAAACADPSGTAVPTPTTTASFAAPGCGATAPAGSLPFVTDLPATDERIVALRCAVDVTAHALGSALPPVGVIAGATIDSTSALVAGVDPSRSADEVADALTRVGAAVFTDPANVVLNLARLRAEAVGAPSERWLLTADVAHELFHVAQWRLFTTPSADAVADAVADAAADRPTAAARLAAEPFWLIETAPQWFAGRLLTEGGFADEQRATAHAVADRADAFPGLAAWETPAGFGAWDPPATRLPAALRFAALSEIGQLLVHRAGADALMHDYWVARAVNAEPWSETFARVFGVSVDDFYAEVARHFAGLEPTALGTRVN